VQQQRKERKAVARVNRSGQGQAPRTLYRTGKTTPTDAEAQGSHRKLVRKFGQAYAWPVPAEAVMAVVRECYRATPIMKETMRSYVLHLSAMLVVLYLEFESIPAPYREYVTAVTAGPRPLFDNGDVDTDKLDEFSPKVDWAEFFIQADSCLTCGRDWRTASRRPREQVQVQV
jgi:hypothetical protein